MPFDKITYPEELLDERRKSVQQSLAPVTSSELRTVMKQHDQEFTDDPWREEFIRLITEQPQASFYRAAPQEDVVVYYCRDADFGVWVIPGSGSGPLDEVGKRVIKEAIEGSLSGQNTGGKK